MEASPLTDEVVDEGLSTFRSEIMTPIRICLPTDDQVAACTIRALAATQTVQIMDGNGDQPITQRRYKQEVQTCIECVRLLRGLEEEVIATDEERKGLFERADDEVSYGVVYTDLEQPLEKLSAWHEAVTRNKTVLAEFTNRKNALIEELEVLQRSVPFREETAQTKPAGPSGIEMSDMKQGLLGAQQDVESQQRDEGRVQCMSGVILTSNQENFSRALFRMQRGLVITTFKQIEQEIRDPISGKMAYKSAFTSFYHGNVAKERIEKLAKAYGANLYDVPDSSKERTGRISECASEIQQLCVVSDQTFMQKVTDLRMFYQQVLPIKKFVKQEMVVYHTLNCFRVSDKDTLLVADCWIPAYAKSIVREALLEGKQNMSSEQQMGYMEPLPETGTFPTYIRTNKFTAPFQSIVNTYGTPRYREINPGFFAVAMFPFLFGIMFGDMVHGLLMLMFALYLIVFENSLANHELGEMFQMVYGARYMIFTMGICATYMGVIYNEALSVAIDLFGDSAYANGEDFPNMPYIFGVDAVWRHSSNLIQFTNSLKMKMSIIVGVAQMMVGIVLKLLNNLHFERYVEAAVESVPEILFMGLTFGYMSVLIFLKWSINYAPEPPPCFSSGCDGVVVDGYPLKAAPPSIIHVMISMFKMEPLAPELAMYAGQEGFQQCMLTIAVCSLPILLVGKPIHIYLSHRRDDGREQNTDQVGYGALPDDDPERQQHTLSNDEEDAHDFSEVVVHQGIHTVEFALGCVSNTASYLRLWALSLAHSQLSEVFWEYILMGYEFSLFGYNPGIAGGPYMLIPCYAVFFACTICILMMMESLSAFLHALRLQWVEFQSKFYAADGILFTPLSFDIEDTEEA